MNVLPSLCPANPELEKAAFVVKDILGSAFPAEKWYSDLRSGREPLIGIEHKELVPQWSAYISGTSCVGLDLPAWYAEITGNHTIMIVGQDPLRQEKDFPPHLDHRKHVLLGTPYAVHLRHIALEKRPSSWARIQKYWSFIDYLAVDARVYITDIYKLFYVRDSSRRSNADPEFLRDPIHEELLLREIKTVKPTLIVTLGRPAANALIPAHSLSEGEKLPSFKGIVPVLKLPHLSGLAARHQVKFLRERGYPVDDVPRSYATLVRDTMNNQSGS